MYTRKQTYMYIHIFIISSSILILVCNCNSLDKPVFSFAIQSSVWAYGRAMAVGFMPAPLHAHHRALLIWRFRLGHTYTHTLSHTLAHTYTHPYIHAPTHKGTLCVGTCCWPLLEPYSSDFGAFRVYIQWSKGLIINLSNKPREARFHKFAQKAWFCSACQFLFVKHFFKNKTWQHIFLYCRTLGSKRKDSIPFLELVQKTFSAVIYVRARRHCERSSRSAEDSRVSRVRRLWLRTSDRLETCLMISGTGPDNITSHWTKLAPVPPLCQVDALFSYKSNPTLPFPLLLNLTALGNERHKANVISDFKNTKKCSLSLKHKKHSLMHI